MRTTALTLSLALTLLAPAQEIALPTDNNLSPSFQDTIASNIDAWTACERIDAGGPDYVNAVAAVDTGIAGLDDILGGGLTPHRVYLLEGNPGSGYGQDEDRRRSTAAGFDHHLVKPIDIDSLVKLLG